MFSKRCSMVSSILTFLKVRNKEGRITDGCEDNSFSCFVSFVVKLNVLHNEIGLGFKDVCSIDVFKDRNVVSVLVDLLKIKRVTVEVVTVVLRDVKQSNLEVFEKNVRVEGKEEEERKL